ncbi:MAG: hypothetical protein AB1635_06145 [Acidobacteriota bacterium]
MSTRRLLRENRAHIADVIQVLATRHHLSADEAREFAAHVERSLLVSDIDLPRAFLDKAGFHTYLLTAITRLFLDFQRDLWGSWRPSPLAERLGATAVLLEELVVRDGLDFDGAVHVMQTAHRVDWSREALLGLFHDLGLDAGAARGGDVPAGPAEPAQAPPSVEEALREALKLLSSEDRLALAMRYIDGASMTRIAKVVQSDLRPLHRRMDDATEVVRRALLERGVSADDVTAILGHPPAEHAERQVQWWRAAVPRGTL